MTKNFDEICKGILGEMVASPAQQQQKPTQPQQPAPGAGAPAAIQNNVQNNAAPQPTQANQPNNEIAKAFEVLTKHVKNNQDQLKAVTALQQLLTAQQQNAANQPVQKA
jgi:hypothetical protein